MSEPLISVIVPVYNVENYVVRCVGSICAQTYTKLEILLVDDGSTDLSGARCDELAEMDTRVQTIHKENGGLSDARNTGMKAASGKYFAFVDSDDYLAEDYIAYLYGMIERHHAQIAVCGYQKVYHSDENTKNTTCNSMRIDEKYKYNGVYRDTVAGNGDTNTDKNSSYRKRDGNNNRVDSEKVYNTEEGLRHLLYQRGMISSAWGRLFDASLFMHRNTRGTNAKGEQLLPSSIDLLFPVGKLHEDVAVMYKLFESADTIVCGDEAKYYYFQRSDSIVNQQFDRRRMDYITFTSECIQFMEKYYPDLRKAAVSRHFSACFELLSCIENNNRYRIEYERLASEIKKYRRIVFRDSNARLINRLAAGGSYISLTGIWKLSRLVRSK
ncbi:MAG: glycosyltransferase [Lachnospiraceae bacterium]|nr:glycosyltransferase [Lachnospiraceae bacterium]